MSLEQGTLLRNGKIINIMLEENTSSSNAMVEPSIADSEANDGSDISSQLSEMKENNERKIGELQMEFSQLKDLMMAIINKPTRLVTAHQRAHKVFQSGPKWGLILAL